MKMRTEEEILKEIQRIDNSLDVFRPGSNDTTARVVRYSLKNMKEVLEWVLGSGVLPCASSHEIFRVINKEDFKSRAKN